MTRRAQIVEEARSWLGTPYRHQARIKRVAVDCIGLVIGVARKLELVPADFDITGYSRQPDPRQLLEQCGLHMVEIDAGAMRPGDVIVTRFEQDPTHFAIVADYYHRGHLSMIHAANRRNGKGGVIENRIDPTNRARIYAAYALPGVA